MGVTEISIVNLFLEPITETPDIDQDAKRCWDSRLNNFSTQVSMKHNGWAFDNIGQVVVTLSRNSFDHCGNEFWYGWRTPEFEGVASVSALLLGSGSAVLDFENCNEYTGIVNAELLDSQNSGELQKLTIAEPNKSATVSFDFHSGMTLRISTELGVVKIRSLEISCAEKCCNQLRVGPGDRNISKVPELMGYFRQMNIISNGAPVWKKGNGTFLFLSKQKRWSIGNDYTTSSARIHHKSCSYRCPEHCSNNWMHLIPGLITNRTIEVKCGLSPVLHGISYELGIADVNSGSVWAKEDYTFTKLPSYLIGAHYFRTNLVPTTFTNDHNLEVKIYAPSTVFIYYNRRSSYGGLDLPGWIQNSMDSINEVETGLIEFNHAQMKIFNQSKETTIPISQSQQNFRGVIFIRDSIHKQYAGHRWCSELCKVKPLEGLRTCNEHYLLNPSRYCETEEYDNDGEYERRNSCFCGEYECKGCDCTVAPLCQV